MVFGSAALPTRKSLKTLYKYAYMLSVRAWARNHLRARIFCILAKMRGNQEGKNNNNKTSI